MNACGWGRKCFKINGSSLEHTAINSCTRALPWKFKANLFRQQWKSDVTVSLRSESFFYCAYKNNNDLVCLLQTTGVITNNDCPRLIIFVMHAGWTMYWKSCLRQHKYISLLFQQFDAGGNIPGWVLWRRDCAGCHCCKWLFCWCSLLPQVRHHIWTKPSVLDPIIGTLSTL